MPIGLLSLRLRIATDQHLLAPPRDQRAVMQYR